MPAAGGHLDEGAAFVGGEGFLEVADGFNPATGGQIYGGAILQNPSTLLQQRVDLLACSIFGGLHEARKIAEI